jgi:hypothetical protein
MPHSIDFNQPPIAYLDAIEDYLTFWDVAVFFGVPLGPLI